MMTTDINNQTCSLVFTLTLDLYYIASWSAQDVKFHSIDCGIYLIVSWCTPEGVQSKDLNHTVSVGVVKLEYSKKILEALKAHPKCWSPNQSTVHRRRPYQPLFLYLCECSYIKLSNKTNLSPCTHLRYT